MTLPPEPEANLLRKVLELARIYHWRSYHTHRSDRSEAGFPDLVLVKPHHPVIFAELKSPKGKLDAAQLGWNADLVACKGEGVLAFVWRSEDLDRIWGILAA